MAPSRYGRTRVAPKVPLFSTSHLLIVGPVREDRWLSSEECDMCVCQSSLVQILSASGMPIISSVPTHTHVHRFRSTFFCHRKTTVGVYIYMHCVPVSVSHFAWWLSQPRLNHNRHQGFLHAPLPYLLHHNEWREGKRKDDSGEYGRKVGAPWGFFFVKQSLSSDSGVFS